MNAEGVASQRRERSGNYEVLAKIVVALWRFLTDILCYIQKFSSIYFNSSFISFLDRFIAPIGAPFNPLSITSEIQKESSLFFLFPSDSIFDEVNYTIKRAKYKIN